jgi:hypothetical protein
MVVVRRHAIQVRADPVGVLLAEVPEQEGAVGLVGRGPPGGQPGAAEPALAATVAVTRAFFR